MLTSSLRQRAPVHVRARRRERIGRRLPAAALVLCAAVLAGCGSGSATATDRQPRPSSPATDPQPHASQTGSADPGSAADHRCPQELRVGEDPSGHGFGTDEPAMERPTLRAPERAWVCQYVAYDAGTTPSGGMVFGWRRVGERQVVAADRLPAVMAALRRLAPADGGRTCTSDLGPRWLLAYRNGGHVTGVLIDDYGCRDVRLTDDPARTAPGSFEQGGPAGTVGGVLDGGVALLEALGVARPR